MITKKLLFILCFVITTAMANTGFAGYISGIEVAGNAQDNGKNKSSLTASDRPGQPGLMAVSPPPTGSTVIDFDDVSASCSWASTPSRLTTEYASQGVVFSGPGGLDGGGIIDECGNFPVSGQSSPNFLGFNPGGSFVDGGTPIGPETMTFNPAVAHVQINGASSSPITMECFSSQVSVGTASIPATVAIDTLSVTAPGIDSCVLTWGSAVAVFDDLAFSTTLMNPVPVPTLGVLALILMFVLIMFVGLRGRSLREGSI